MKVLVSISAMIACLALAPGAPASEATDEAAPAVVQEEKSAAAAPTCDDIREAYLETCEALHDIRLVSSKEYLQLPWIPPIVKQRPGYIPQNPGPYFYRFARSGEKYGWWFYGSKVDWGNGKSTDWTVTDGKASLHVTDMRDKPYSDKAGTAIRNDRQVGIDVSAGTSLLFTGWYNGPTPPEALACDECRVSGEPVEAGGVSTWLVEGKSAGAKVKYWFAPEYGWLPVRVELWTSDGLLNRREFDQFQEVADGAWFPMHMIDTQFEDGGEKVDFKVEWKVLEVEVDPELEADTFDVSLWDIPDGFEVQDALSGENYTAGERIPPESP